MEEGKISRVVTRAHGLADWLVATLVAERLERAGVSQRAQCVMSVIDSCNILTYIYFDPSILQAPGLNSRF